MCYQMNTSLLRDTMTEIVNFAVEFVFCFNLCCRQYVRG